MKTLAFGIIICAILAVNTTAAERQTEKKDNANPAPVAFSPDGRFMAISVDKSISFFDPQSGKEIARCLGHNDIVTALAFSPDGKTVASGSKDKSVALWDVGTFRQLRKFALNDAVSTVRFSADSSTLIVVGGNTNQRRFDIATGKELPAQ